MADGTECERLRALAELAAREAQPCGRMPWGLRLLMRRYPLRRPPYYGDHLFDGLALGLIFALPAGGVVTFAIVENGTVSLWLAAALALFAWAGFGLGHAAYLATAGRRMGLTPWERLGGRGPEEG